MINKNLIKVTNVYRVPTVYDALALREELSKNNYGELTSFSYTTKYVKATDEEYQVVKATISFNDEKNPESNVDAFYGYKEDADID
nr:MAG TPA: hypothetical protein [Caudoviricetes sp.]